MCYCPTPTLHLNLALTGDGAFLLSPKKTHTVWFISVLNYGDTENVLINPLLLVIPMSYPCHYTNLCPHKSHKHAHTPHTHTPPTHTHMHAYTRCVSIFHGDIRGHYGFYTIANCISIPLTYHWHRKRLHFRFKNLVLYDVISLFLVAPKMSLHGQGFGILTSLWGHFVSITVKGIPEQTHTVP